MSAHALPGYDAWKTNPPRQLGEACATCGGTIVVDRRDPDTAPFDRHGDDAVCSYACDAAWRARNGEGVDAVMAAIADMMDADCEAPLVHARLDGGGREVVGTVVDWNVDGTLLVVEDASGRERNVRRAYCRAIEVVDA